MLESTCLSQFSFWISCLFLCSGLDFHEDLHRIGAKEGLKGRKLQKAMESYAWNITVLKVSERHPGELNAAPVCLKLLQEC